MSGAVLKLHSNNVDLPPPGVAIAELARLRTEVEALRRRVVELETAWTEALPPSPLTPEDGEAFIGGAELLEESRAILGAMLAHGPTVVFVKDVAGRYALINRHFSTLFDATPAAVLGKTDYDLFPAEVATRIRRTDQEILVGGRPHEYEGTIPTPHGERTFSTLKVPVHARRGDILGLACFSSDVTDLRRAQAERDLMEQRARDAREATLRELEAPLMPIAPGVLAVPLVGELGEARARRVEDVVLSGVSAHHVEWVILDVTGLRTAGAEAIAGLSRVARAARLLGARVVVTGMRAEVARALGAMGEGKHEFTPLSTLACGIEYTLRQRRKG